MHKSLYRLLACFLVLMPLACSAQPEAFVEGEHYREVRNVESSDDGKIRVTEVFWYGCPHCYQFEPVIKEWSSTTADDVVFEQLPTAFGRPSGRNHLKAFYAADELDVQQEVHSAIFNAIHEQSRRPSSEQEMAGFFEQAGVAPEDFEKTFGSFTVENRVRRAEKRVSDFGVTSVPTVIVDGRWQVNAGAAGSYERMLEIVDFLIKKARD